MKIGTYIASLVVALLVIFSMVILSGGSYTHFINVPALIVVVVFPAAMLRAGFPFSEMGRHFRNAVGKPGMADPPELRQGVVFFSAMRTYLLLSGFLGTLVGTITMLANLTDESKIGFGAALALLTVLYALALWGLIALPMRSSLQKQVEESSR
jgi:flagellar motor component MotA